MIPPKIFSSKVEVNKPDFQKLGAFLGKYYPKRQIRSQEEVYSKVFLETHKSREIVGRFVEDFILTSRYNLKMIRPKTSESKKLIFVCERSCKKGTEDELSDNQLIASDNSEDITKKRQITKKGMTKRSEENACYYRLSFELTLNEEFCFSELKKMHNHEPCNEVSQNLSPLFITEYSK